MDVGESNSLIDMVNEVSRRVWTCASWSVKTHSTSRLWVRRGEAGRSACPVTGCLCGARRWRVPLSLLSDPRSEEDEKKQGCFISGIAPPGRISITWQHQPGLCYLTPDVFRLASRPSVCLLFQEVKHLCKRGRICNANKILQLWVSQSVMMLFLKTRRVHN